MAVITRLIHFFRLCVGIDDTDVEYADSTSSTVAPTTGWQTTAPKWQNGHFIWTRTHITYNDGDEKYTSPVCLPSGKGIAKIVEQYYSSTSATSLTGGAWSETAPSWANGRYIWTRSVIYYTDGTSQTTNPICATGSKGEQGDPGKPGKDGADGTSVNIKGTLSNSGYLPTSGASKGDGYIIDGDLWVYTGYEGGNDATHMYGFENVGKIQGPQGKPGTDATQYYYHVAWCNTPDNSDKSFTVECSDGEAYAYMGTCINTTEADPDTFSSYNWVKVKGDHGEDGKDAITITMSLTAICHKKSSTDSRYATEVKMFEGDKQVPFIFSYISSYDGVTISSSKKGDGRIFYLTVKAGAVVNCQVSLSFSYKDKTYQRVIPITTAVDGEPGAKGEVGAVLRGPQSWSDLGDGYTFEAGGEGDEWKDVVIYGSTFYSCIKSHVKTATNYPGSDEALNNKYWQAGSPMEIIATKILLSQYALVKNLGVEAIEMKGENDDKASFYARDGKLTCQGGNFENIKCQKGTFDNVEVNGDIKAYSIKLKLIAQGSSIDGAVYTIGSTGNLVLPELGNQECMNIKVAVPRITRSSIGPRVKPATDKVYIWESNSTDLPASKEVWLDCGIYDLVGSGYDGKTYWAIK